MRRKVKHECKHARDLASVFSLLLLSLHLLKPAKAIVPTPQANSVDCYAHSQVCPLLAQTINPAQQPISVAAGSPNTGTRILAPVTGPDARSIQHSSTQVVPSMRKGLPQKVRLAITENPIYLSDAVKIADQNYPGILKAQAEARAADMNVPLQVLTEYLPDSLFQIQYLAASRSKIVQDFWASLAFPAMAGPASSGINLTPQIFSNVGVGLDWSLLDFGLHKSRIQLARCLSKTFESQAAVTRFDTEVTAVSAYLDCVQALRQVKAVEENVSSIEEFIRVADVQVQTQLKPAIDLALVEAELAAARAQLYRARLSLNIAEFNLDNALGLADADVKVLDRGLADIIEDKQIQPQKPVFEQVPALLQAHAELLSSLARKRVIKHEFDPVFHWIGGWNQRGGPVAPNGVLTGRDAYGFAPVYPNYEIALVVSWNFLDYFRIRLERKIQDERIAARQYQVDLVLNNLITLDRSSRERLKEAIDYAGAMPAAVNAAEAAQKAATIRYSVGLSSVAQVAQANQVLARAKMEQAIANVGIWRALLEIASAHGDLRPLLAEADKVQRL